MSKPIILALDDDPHVLRAVERDLRAEEHWEEHLVRVQRLVPDPERRPTQGKRSIETVYEHEINRVDDTQ